MCQISIEINLKVEEIKSSGTNEEKCVNLLKAWIAEEEEGASPDEIT